MDKLESSGHTEALNSINEVVTGVQADFVEQEDSRPQSSQSSADSLFNRIRRQQERRQKGGWVRERGSASSDDSDGEIPTERLIDTFASSLTVLDAGSHHEFGSAQFYNQLVDQHIEASKRLLANVEIREFGNLRALSQKVLCMGTISLDYMLWTLQNEYDDIEKKKTTSAEQLLKTRELLMQIGK
jgi:hypothetical protein